MILYLDTSAVVKLFIRETNTDYVLGLVSQTSQFATSKICQVEFSAALAKSVRMGWCGQELMDDALRQFNRTWVLVIKIEVDTGIIESAAELAWKHGLRGYDAVHLSSAMFLGRLLHSPVSMLTYDRQLWEVSRKVGIVTLPESL